MNNTIFPEIKHVFVLMLENHSFDNMLAMSGIPGLTCATTSNFNTYNGTQYFVQKGAPTSMPTDPGHEFLDVLEQLTGQSAYQPGEYPPISNEGFAESYATSTSEPPHNTPATDQIGDIMKCFDTPNQLPVLYALATEFAVCDHWFSSLPGPTWPNRFFVHGASSSGLDDSPTVEDYLDWTIGFKYANGSIFERIGSGNYRIYHDCSGPLEGWIPQTASLSGISIIDDLYSFDRFADDLRSDYPAQYTFIEPSYGSISSTYQGGSSQHPMDDVGAGEALIKATYEAIRNSPLWDSSLFIITYDEHGGFYDSVIPPKGIVAPGDNNMTYSQHDFDFTVYGPRVPAVVVSPFIQKGTVSNTIYDHSSVIATLNQLFGYTSLTARDEYANNLLGLLSLSESRIDCPETLPEPVIQQPLPSQTSTELLQENIPQSGNLVGFMHIALKAHLEIEKDNPAGQAAAMETFKKIQTRQDAKTYLESIVNKIQAAKKH